MSRTLATIAGGLLATLPVAAVTFDFSDSSQFTSNFYTTYIEAGSPSGTLTVESGKLNHSSTGGSTIAWVYDTAPDIAPDNKVGSFTASLDLTLNAANASFDIYFGGLGRSNSALALFNVNNARTVQLRPAWRRERSRTGLRHTPQTAMIFSQATP